MKRPAEIVAAARELAALCAEIRQAHPEHAWKEPSAEPKEKRIDPRVAGALRMYQAGAPNAAIAQYCGLTVGALYPTIAGWRKRGWWPADATRKRGRPGKG